MAEPNEKPKGQWNLRPFPEDIKRECLSRASKEGKRDWKWLADYLRKVLPIIQTSDVLDSAHESEQAKIRGFIPQASRAAPAKKRKP
jgi:hypothetical protein